MGESKTMKRIRVLHSELNGELGGIESFLYNVYRFIDKEKVEFDFLTISDTPAYGDKFKKMGSTVYKVPKHINFLGYYFAIDKILREGNYDIVHIHKNSAIDILILKVLQRFPNIKVVVHSHNTFPSVGGKLEKLHKFNRKYLYDNADYRLACSDNAGKWMYGNGAFEIIKNGIDTKGSMHIRAAFIIASEAIYSPSAEYKRVPDKIINKAKQWSEQYPKKIEFQEAYFGLLFSRLKYAQAQDMRNEQRRVYREMKTVAERANYSEYNESNQLMESVDILHRVFGY